MFDEHTLLFKEIRSRGAIKLADVLRLRRDYIPDGITQESEAHALFALDAACPVQDTTWMPLFVETITGFIVARVKPEGYLTVNKARWLMSHATTGSRIERLSCLELFIDTLEAARWSPPSLSAFVLRQIEIDIVTGNGPLRTGATSGRGRVGRAAVGLIRRVLAAGDRGEGAPITRAEAEVLLDIHDATIAADNCLEWTELFTKAVASVLMTASGYACPARAQALQSEPWFDPVSPQQAFLDVMATRGFQAVFANYKPQTSEQKALAHLEDHKIEIITAEAIPSIEPSWLAARLDRAPNLAPATRAVLSFLRTQRRTLHPALQPLLEKSARAA